MSFRQILILINVVAIVAIIAVIVARVLSVKANPQTSTPANQEAFLDDDELENRRLERSLGWALVFVVVIAVSLPLYFLFEPARQSSADEAFDDRAVDRGATFYADSSMEEYDATRSLLCAQCHGADLGGGTAPFVLTSEDPDCDPLAEPSADRPQCLPQPVSWAAPELDTIFLTYTEEQIREIIVFGRPGTPMPAWGLESNEGVLNSQGVSDIMAFLESRQLSPDEARERNQARLDDYLESMEAAVAGAETGLEDARANLAASPDDEWLQRSVSVAEGNLEWARLQLAEVQELSEGAILFRLNCARCHTKNWSVTSPNIAPLYPWMLPGPQGGGAYGPNLTDGATVRQFPGMSGPDDQWGFVASGVERGRSYGIRGISSGRMPHFADVLTDEQIQAIVDYERGL